MDEMTLEIVEGPDAGEQVRLTAPLTIGRGTDAGLVLPDAQVSRHHARVTPQDGYAVVEDLGSANGTFVNDSQVDAPARLDADDELHVGVTVLLLRTAREVAAQPSAVRVVPPALAAPVRQPNYVPPDFLEKKPEPANPGQDNLNALRDVSVRKSAKTAPIAILALAALVVIIYLAT